MAITGSATRIVPALLGYRGWHTFGPELHCKELYSTFTLRWDRVSRGFLVLASVSKSIREESARKQQCMIASLVGYETVETGCFAYCSTTCCRIRGIVEVDFWKMKRIQSAIAAVSACISCMCPMQLYQVSSYPRNIF